MKNEKTPDNTCNEFAIFRVSENNFARVIELSLAIFEEINAEDTLILTHNIFQKTDNKEELCWHLTWKSKEAVEAAAAKWPNYPSTKELETLVGEKLYYGHFFEIANK